MLKNKENVKKIRIKLVVMLLLFTLIIPMRIQEVAAFAGDPNDFPANEAPLVTPIVVSDYFSVPNVSDTFFHPDYSNVVVITQNAGNQKGAVWSNEKMPLTSAFSYETYLYVGASANRGMGGVSGIAGADGMTFTMQNDPAGKEALGAYGHGLGAYAVAGRSNGIKNAISFEFDSYPDTYDIGTGDIVRNNANMHTGFVIPTDPNGYSKHTDVKFIGEYDDTQGSILSRWVPFDATWVPNEDGSGDLTIMLNGVLSYYHINNYLTFFGGDSIYFGYTAATGTGYEMHAIAIEKMPSSYYMHFDLNAPDLEGETVDSQILEKGDYAQPFADPIRTAYTFKGWNTQADGSGFDWDFANMVMNEGDFTVYAQWEVNTYPLSFETQGADSPIIASQNVIYDQLAKDEANPAKQGYTFEGWNTKADGSGLNWDFTATKMPANPVILYAQWTANSYKLSFDLQSGDSAIIPNQEVIFDTLANAVENPSRQGYTFKGWNTKADGSGLNWDLTVTKMPANDVELYAQWQENAKPVTPVEPISPAKPIPPTKSVSPVNSNLPKTGDSSGVMVWSILLLGAGSIAMKMNRKRKHL